MSVSLSDFSFASVTYVLTTQTTTLKMYATAVYSTTQKSSGEDTSTNCQANCTSADFEAYSQVGRKCCQDCAANSACRQGHQPLCCRAARQSGDAARATCWQGIRLCGHAISIGTIVQRPCHMSYGDRALTERVLNAVLFFLNRYSIERHLACDLYAALLQRPPPLPPPPAVPIEVQNAFKAAQENPGSLESVIGLLGAIQQQVGGR